jgi:hypothetical protein
MFGRWTGFWKQKAQKTILSAAWTEMTSPPTHLCCLCFPRRMRLGEYEGEIEAIQELAGK